MKCDKQACLGALDQMDSDLQENFARFDQFSQSEIQKRKSPKDWSVLEILEHLRVSEAASLKYMKKKSSYRDTLVRTGLKHRLKTKFMIKAFQSKVKFPAPTNVPGLNPINANLDYDTVKKEWLDSRIELRSFIEKLDDDLFEMAIFKHPLSGRINLRQTLAFYEVHIFRHLRQIQRTLDD